MTARLLSEYRGRTTSWIHESVEWHLIVQKSADAESILPNVLADGFGIMLITKFCGSDSKRYPWNRPRKKRCSRTQQYPNATTSMFPYPETYLRAWTTQNLILEVATRACPLALLATGVITCRRGRWTMTEGFVS